MKVLTNDSKIKMIFKKRNREIFAHVGSIFAEYAKSVKVAKEYNWEVKPLDEYIEEDLKNGGSKFWTCQRSCCICGDPGYYEREEAKWKDAIFLEEGEEVMIDGHICTAKVLGDYSDPIKFTEV